MKAVSSKSTDGTVRRSRVFMDTTVTLEVSSVAEQREALAAIERAFDCFARVEAACSRFDSASELRTLSAHPGVTQLVSPLLFDPLSVAMALAEETEGAFDPTVGGAMAAAGFDREYRTGRHTGSEDASDEVTYRAVHLDPHARTVLLDCALTLDLGAVAKGFAIDLATNQLLAFERVAVFAGGDLFVRAAPSTPAFLVGIQHPRQANALIGGLSLREGAVCTSGDYQRVAASGHHILDPRTGSAASGAASVTVMASTAMLADGLSTAAFALGPEDGLELIAANAAEGLIVTPELECFATSGFWSEHV